MHATKAMHEPRLLPLPSFVLLLLPSAPSLLLCFVSFPDASLLDDFSFLAVGSLPSLALSPLAGFFFFSLSFSSALGGHAGPDCERGDRPDCGSRLLGRQQR